MIKKGVLWRSIALGGLAAAYGCEGARTTEHVAESSQTAPTVASVSFAQTGNFSGNSVRICGARNPAADTQYPCASDLADLGGTAGSCGPCRNFLADGTLQGGAIESLCPTDVNLPSGATWSFTYEIWTEPDCSGTVLNADGNPNNFVCYDSQDLATQSFPNQSVNVTVTLEGPNVREIFCVSEGSTKDWQVHGCTALGANLYDCECSLVEGVCACDGVDELPSGCVFDGSCNLDCSGGP